jgi:hypothetical protein
VAGALPGFAVTVGLFEELYDYAENGNVGYAIAVGAIAGGISYVGGILIGKAIGK